MIRRPELRAAFEDEYGLKSELEDLDAYLTHVGIHPGAAVAFALDVAALFGAECAHEFAQGVLWGLVVGRRLRAAEPVELDVDPGAVVSPSETLTRDQIVAVYRGDGDADGSAPSGLDDRGIDDVATSIAEALAERFDDELRAGEISAVVLAGAAAVWALRIGVLLGRLQAGGAP